MAGKFHRDHPDAAQDWREYISAAYEGLVEAVRRWDPKRSETFERYAAAIMWRRIIDYLRVHGRYTRNQKRHAVWFRSYDAQVANGGSTYLEQIAGTVPSAADCAEANDTAEQFWRTVCSALRPRWAAVLVLYYRCGLTMREIGECMGVTESRVSQIHKRALCQLFVAM